MSRALVDRLSVALEEEGKEDFHIDFAYELARFVADECSLLTVQHINSSLCLGSWRMSTVY
jgi:hypothetical protein